MVMTLLAFALLPASAGAQSNADGFLLGSVAGSAEGLQGATIVVRNSATGAERQVRLARDGSFVVSSLPVGNYAVLLRRPGQPDRVQEQVAVRLGLGASVRFNVESREGGGVVQLGEFRVDDTAISPVNMTLTESMTLLRDSTLNQLPIGRDITGVTLLVPGSVRGEPSFDLYNLQPLASFGGSSVAENAYYINGFNVTNFRTGLGASTVPFAFYDEFQLKTGGYGAEFGRSTGGVINITTKRGGNTFHGGISTYFEPAWLHARVPDVNLPDGSPYLVSRENEGSSLNTNVYVSGPMVKNRVFFHALYNVRRVREDMLRVNATQLAQARDDDPFWGAKLDVQLADEHLVELTAFSDRRDRVESAYDYDLPTGLIGSFLGDTHIRRGGNNFIARYTGQFTDNFSLSALHGRGEYHLTTVGDGSDIPAIYDEFGTPVGGWAVIRNTDAIDRRRAYRIDANLRLGAHQLRFGYDAERNRSREDSRNSGGYFWQYLVAPWDSSQLLLIEEVYQLNGTFRSHQEAWYVEDTFKTAQDRLTLYAGLRSETFDNRNKLGEAFVRIHGQLAPRLGFAYALDPERQSRVFGNVGRYHLPVPADRSLRMAGGELWSQSLYSVMSRNSDGTPNKGPQFNGVVLSDGSVPDHRTVTNRDLKPMYQDEIILGWQTAIAGDWTLGIRGIHRDLRRVIEDASIDLALQSYADRHAIAAFRDNGVSDYVLTNPGTDLRLSWDIDDDGALEDIVLENDRDLHLSRAKRRYHAIEVTMEKIFSDRWFFQASYTWSQSYGNTEGYVRSDLRQGASGGTVSFDLPELQINSYGSLPNDRRHSFKAYGARRFSERLAVGANLLVQSGRPINALGNNPVNDTPGYNGSFFAVKQGSAGRTPWVVNLDLSFSYQASRHLRLGVDVFNVFNLDRATRVYETRVDEVGVPDPRYRLPLYFQPPRSVRVSAVLEF